MYAGLMNELVRYTVVYILGGITFIPLLLSYLLLSSTKSKPPVEDNGDQKRTKHDPNGKSGWIRLTKKFKSRESDLSNVTLWIAGLQSYVQGATKKCLPKEQVYAELKCGALFIYPDQQREECQLIIPIHNYNVSIYSEKPDCQDHEVFSKLTAIRLTPKMSRDEPITTPQDDLNLSDESLLGVKDELFVTCARSVDKEDWYFGLLAATHIMTESPNQIQVEMVDTTQFDASAMDHLIATVQQDAAYREVQWLNAILGRLFLSVYKTEQVKQLLQEKIIKKVKKVKLPSYLGEILVQRVHMGYSSPFLTEPKLLSLTTEGDLLVEANIHYSGGLSVEIQTEFIWSYSSLMKPIKVPLVLSVMLKKLEGRFVFKLKPPPSNRVWIGFYELPDMTWEITPIVSDKQIRLSMVTNAIQSKIREFMLDTLVLPNMDDFPFYSSVDEGLGGIFGQRIPKPSTPDPTPGTQAEIPGNHLKRYPVTSIDSRYESAMDEPILPDPIPEEFFDPPEPTEDLMDSGPEDFPSALLDKFPIPSEVCPEPVTKPETPPVRLAKIQPKKNPIYAMAGSLFNKRKNSLKGAHELIESELQRPIRLEPARIKTQIKPTPPPIPPRRPHLYSTSRVMPLSSQEKLLTPTEDSYFHLASHPKGFDIPSIALKKHKEQKEGVDHQLISNNISAPMLYVDEHLENI